VAPLPAKHQRPKVRSSPRTDSTKAASVPRSILRTSPKYTVTSSSRAAVDPVVSLEQEKETAAPRNSGPASPLVVRERVSEKPRRTRKERGAVTTASSAFCIEGYTTTNQAATVPLSSDSNASHEKDIHAEEDAPLVFNALSDMMALAGTLPSVEENSAATPQMIEAELNFSVFDPEDYQAHQMRAREESTGTTESDDDDDEMDDLSVASTNSTADQDPGDASDQDEDVLWSAMTNKDVDEEAVEPASPPRAFLLFWQALAQWVTPAAVAYLDSWRGGSSSGSPVEDAAPPPMAHDVAIARFHAVQAMLRMPTMEGRRRVEPLLRRMDFSRPTPKFTTAQWQGLSAVLLDMVQWDGRAVPAALKPPPACQTLGMTWDEYRYLVQSSLLSFR
jgi:hypothetical protein